jgi:hypothetical protein
MKIIFVFLLIQPFLCQGCTTDNSTNNSDARKVVESFYKWYIDDAYKNEFDYYQVPPFKKIGDKEYIFDKVELGIRLNKIKQLSEKYKKNILEKLEMCNREMQKKKWQQEPEPQFNIRQCDYLWYDNWLGGQGESISGFKIIKEINSQTGVEFIVEILIDKKLFTKSKVLVEKEKGYFKISNIELIWD